MCFSAKRPAQLGVHNDTLSPCPDSPNCVSSRAQEARHAISPFSFKEDPIKEMGRIEMILNSMTGITVIKSKQNYLYAECKSLIFGFVDDLEFYWSEEEKTCHVRSASRLGYSDFGKNRKRVEFIRRQSKKK